MRAVTFEGRNKVAVSDVDDPTIREPGDVILRVTSSAICGSDIFANRKESCVKVVLKP